MNTRKHFIVAMGLAVALGGASAASAETTWEHNHPDREQVNDRLTHQDARIHQERREGEINGRQAHRMHAADHRIRMSERRFARHHDGRISRAEEERVNHRENDVSDRIGR